MMGRIVSQYEITGKLGSGGMGVVYKAWDTRLNRLAALKFLPPELNADPEAKARFIQEAQAAAALDHPSICTIYEIGETGDSAEYGESRLFIAMAYYGGKTLDDRIGEGPLPPDEALGVALKVAQGLARAHAEGIIHRDIKPANIILTDDGEVKILDFGIAKMPGQATLTRAGSTIGTAAYMSPEQARGEQVDGRSDLWSLGVILYQMLSGRLPFEGDFDQALIYGILNQEPAELKGVDENILGILDRLLAKDREDRYPTADDLLTDLMGVRSGPQVAVPRRKRRPSWLRYAYLAVPLLILLGAWQFWPSASSDPPPTAIAVAPFENLTGKEDFDLWSRGIANLIGDELASSPTLLVLDAYTVSNVLDGLEQESGGTLSPAGMITRVATQLKVKTLVIGSIIASGDSIRVQAKLHDIASGKSRSTQKATVASEGDFFALALDLGGRLRNSLEIELLGETIPQNFKPGAGVGTNSPQAYRHFIQALDWEQAAEMSKAMDEIEAALEIDPNFNYARFLLMLLKMSSGDDVGSIAQLDLLEAAQGQMGLVQRYQINCWSAYRDKDIYTGLDYFRKLQDLEPLNPLHYVFPGVWYFTMDQPENAVPQLEKCLELSRQQNGFYSRYISFFKILAGALIQQGNHDRAVEVCQLGLERTDENTHFVLQNSLAAIELRRGDPEEAQVWLDLAQASLEKLGAGPYQIGMQQAGVFREAENFERAREILVRLCAEVPDGIEPREKLADLLIEQNLAIDEAQRLIDECIEIATKFEHPEYARSHNILLLQGKAQLGLGQPEQAVEFLEAANVQSAWYSADVEKALGEARAALKSRAQE